MMSDQHLQLEAIVGRWRTERQALAVEPLRVFDTDTYELLAGGHSSFITSTIKQWSLLS